MSFKLNWVRLLLTAIMAPGVVFAEQPASPMPPPTAPNPLFFANKGTTAEQKLTKTDIPQNLPRELKKEIEATFDNSAMERGAAAEKLGRRGEAAVAAVPFLIRLLSDDGDCGVRWIDAKDGRTLQLSEDVRDRAVTALIAVGKPAVAPCLSALRHSSGEARGNVAFVLGQSRDERALFSVIALIGDRDPALRKAVVLSLDHWNDPRLIAPLTTALKDTNEEVRREATVVLADFRDPRLVPPLLESFKDKDASVRSGAARALGAQRDSRAVTPLLEVLNDTAEDQGLRIDSALALGDIADHRGDDGLLVVLKDRSINLGIRLSAARAIAVSRESRFIDPLTELAKDAEEASDVRGVSVNTIASLAGARAIPVLEQLAKDEKQNSHVRCCAAMCLVKLTNGAIGETQIVKALVGPSGPDYERSITAVAEGAREKKIAIRLVAQKGKTEDVRAAAIALLKRLWPHDTLGAGSDRHYAL